MQRTKATLRLFKNPSLIALSLARRQQGKPCPLPSVLPKSDPTFPRQIYGRGVGVNHTARKRKYPNEQRLAKRSHPWERGVGRGVADLVGLDHEQHLAEGA
jgi:hypothetical protein